MCLLVGLDVLYVHALTVRIPFFPVVSFLLILPWKGYPVKGIGRIMFAPISE